MPETGLEATGSDSTKTLSHLEPVNGKEIQGIAVHSFFVVVYLISSGYHALCNVKLICYSSCCGTIKQYKNELGVCTARSENNFHYAIGQLI